MVSVDDYSPSNLYVRLLGDPDTIAPKPVHWTRARRFAGKDFTTTPALIRSAQHDLAKFKIREFAGWRVGNNGEVELLVAWHGFEDARSTWEPVSQMIADAPYRVRNYLSQNAEGHPPLQAVYDNEYD